MQILLYIAPIILVIGLVATGRVPLGRASLAGLIATLPAAAVALNGQRDYLEFFTTESLKGAWLAWHSITVILAGLLTHHVITTAAVQHRDAGAAATADGSRHRRAYFLCFIASGVIECAIGFGIGYALAIQGLRRLGAPVHAAVALGLLSQMLVAWGALAIGTVIGAALGDLPLDRFGLYSASLLPAFALSLLAWFWLWSHRLGFGMNLRNAVIDLGWTAALLGLLWIGNRYVSVDTAGLVATAPLLALSQFFNRDRPPLASMLRIAAPYLLLIGLLFFTRLNAALGHWLQGIAMLRPYEDLPAFPWFHHAATMLLLTALLYGGIMLRREGWATVLHQTWQGGRVAVATTLIFLVMARLLAASGIPVALADAWQSFAGSHALLISPVFAALGGALAGGNTASNSLMLPLQAALASAAGASVLWISALQNVASSLFTPLAPGKMAMACAFAGWAGGERQAYRATLPLFAALLLIAVLLTLLF